MPDRRAPIESLRFIPRLAAAAVIALSALAASPAGAPAQDFGTDVETPSPAGDADETSPPRQPVSVAPTAGDADIANRLARILRSTGWFEAPRVAVSEGVVTLDGTARTQDHRTWAGDLARNTEGVVAVVNRVDVEADVRSTFDRAGEEIAGVVRRAIQVWPLVLLALVIILVAWVVSRLVGALARWFFGSRVPSPLLLAVVVRLFSVPVFLLGVYFVLQVAGLTRLAVTVLGGTGLIGIVIGFAFRDIAENFLASLLLSVRNPFRSGDLIEVAGHTGIVQNLNTRSTVLMTLDGNHVQIPNAMVFKSTITNYSSTPRRRADFVVGIGYDSPTAQAQALISDILRNHPAVLDEPEPLVLVEELGPATVNLRVRYWFDSATYAPDKTNSALLRLSKTVLLKAGIELPDTAREVVFPRGVPLIQAGGEAAAGPAPPAARTEEESRDSTAGEGNLSQESPMGTEGEVPEATENLLKK